MPASTSPSSAASSDTAPGDAAPGGAPGDAPPDGAAPRDTPLPERRRVVAIALVAATTIVLQVALTRVLSVVVWYHWAFLAVTLALLGVAAPGVWLSFVRERMRWLGVLLLGAGVAVPSAIAVVVRSPGLVGAEHAPWLCLGVCLGAFLALGGATCLLLLSAPGRDVGRLYGADLVGASLGACLTVPLLTLGPTPQVAAALGLLPLAAHACLWPRRWVLPVLGAAALVAALGAGSPFAVRHTKTYAEGSADRTPVYERWSPTVRVTVFDSVFWSEQAGPFLWGPGRERPGRPGHEQYWLEQDGSAGTPLARLTSDPAELDALFDDVTAVGLLWRHPREVAVVGAGGGRDVVAALAAGATHVDAIELHPLILETVRGPFGARTGHLYDDPRVTPIVGEGRHVLSQQKARYDLIQIALTDSWAATTAGAYSLSENHLYTVEAYELYWSRLNDAGVVATSRWVRGDFGLEVPRLLFLAEAALERAGVTDPVSHLVVLQGGAVGTVLLGRRAFTREELVALDALATARGFVIHFPPSLAADGLLSRAFAAGPEIYARQGVRMTPPTDDRPFFFQVLSPFGGTSHAAARSFGVNNEGVFTLRLVLGIVALAGVALLLVPFLYTGHFERTDLWRGSAYFVCIGLAFLLVELTWLAKLVLVLGHPSLAATVTLGALLLGSGLGSLAATRVGLAAAQRYGFVTALVGASATLAATWAAPALLAAPLAVRVLLTALTLVGCGVTMGPAFALGLARFGDANKPWFWAVNGAASVLAGAGAIALAMELGYTAVALVGAALYLGAWPLLRGTPVAATPPG